MTILNGGNGSGKSTILNLIAAKLALKTSDTPINQSHYFNDFVSLCSAELAVDALEHKNVSIPTHSRIITSDDVFNQMLTLRKNNIAQDSVREDLLFEHLQTRHSERLPFALSDSEALPRQSRRNEINRLTASEFSRRHSLKNKREYSNGESAYMYFSDAMTQPGLYLLDEPENSLAPALQLELFNLMYQKLKEGCQIIMATHSPLLLAFPQATVYDLDSEIVTRKEWYELDNCRTYYDFFKKHADEFERQEMNTHNIRL